MSTGALIPIWRWALMDDDGAPLPGALLYTWLSGTSTPHAVYADVNLTVPLSNPVVADAGGVFPAIFLDAVAYRMQVNTADDETVYPAQDDITNLAQVSGSGTDVTGTAGVNLSARDVAYLSDGSGGLTAGKWYKGDADFTYASTTPEVGFVVSDALADAAVTVRMLGRMTGFTALGAGTIYYISATAGALTSSAPANARIVCQADSTTSIIIGQIASADGAAPGSDTQVVFNDTGDFGASADFTFDGTTVTMPTATLSDGQIVFPATQNPSAGANTLDDYERGTWTVTLTGSGGSSGQTYASRGGYYQKVGAFVTIIGGFTLTAKGTITGSVRITGLPFPADADVDQFVAFKFSDMTTAIASMVGIVADGTSYITLEVAAAGGSVSQSTIGQADLSDTTTVNFFATYKTTE
jgi:hypothetical protein